MPSDSDRLIHALTSQPRLFGPGIDRVELLETHISWVLLAGAFAWKIKKPVDFGFLDFSTLERRRQFCEEELRLNGRLAPDLYLDVVPITGTCDAPHLDGDGEPIEYAVRMRRFRQTALLSTALREKRVEPAHIDRLADIVATFHARIETAPLETTFGAPEQVMLPVEENFRQLSLTPASANDRLAQKVAALHAWCCREHRERSADISARKAAGCIRECHGDMHLGNMLLGDDGSVGIFDGIEFNDSLRWIDVASEIAFVTMDLEDRGRPDLAHRFLNAYLERTGDYGALSVLPFYQVYRATVRAKVACLRSKQGSLDPTEMDGLRKEFRSYIELADRYTQPPAPFLMITCGVSGSGKSWGSQPVVDELGAVRIRSDVERKRLFGLQPLDSSRSSFGAGIYSREASRRTYERLQELARSCLGAGRSVIVDATFLSKSSRDIYRRIADEMRVPFIVVAFDAPPEILRERIRQRQSAGSDASEATLEVLEDQLRHREPLQLDEMPHAIFLDTTTAGVDSKLPQLLRDLLTRNS